MHWDIVVLVLNRHVIVENMWRTVAATFIGGLVVVTFLLISLSKALGEWGGRVLVVAVVVLWCLPLPMSFQHVYAVVVGSCILG